MHCAARHLAGHVRCSKKLLACRQLLLEVLFSAGSGEDDADTESDSQSTDGLTQAHTSACEPEAERGSAEWYRQHRSDPLYEITGALSGECRAPSMLEVVCQLLTFKSDHRLMREAFERYRHLRRPP